MPESAARAALAAIVGGHALEMEDAALEGGIGAGHGLLWRQRVAGAALLALLLGAAVAPQSAPAGAPAAAPADLTVRRLVVVDDHGRARLELGQDPADTQRRSRSCGLTIFDATGAERGGLSTMDDGSVVLGLDAPVGVGSPMRDHIGMVVAPDGSARIDLINNETLLPVRLVSDADGTGGVEFFKYDLDKRECTVRRLSEAGESTRVLPLGDGK
jgi:hypothetical protein